MRQLIPRLRLLRDNTASSSMVPSAGRFADPGGVIDIDPSDDVGGVSGHIAIETSKHVSGPDADVAMTEGDIIAGQPADADREVMVLSPDRLSRQTDDCVRDGLVEQDWFGGVSDGGVRSLSESDGAMLSRVEDGDVQISSELKLKVKVGIK